MTGPEPRPDLRKLGQYKWIVWREPSRVDKHKYLYKGFLPKDAPGHRDRWIPHWFAQHLQRENQQASWTLSELYVEVVSVPSQTFRHTPDDVHRSRRS